MATADLPTNLPEIPVLPPPSAPPALEMPALLERVQTLEAVVLNLQWQLQQLLEKQKDEKEHWVEKMSGSMKDYPEFEEVCRLGREFRQSDRPPDDE